MWQMIIDIERWPGECVGDVGAGEICENNTVVTLMNIGDQKEVSTCGSLT